MSKNRLFVLFVASLLLIFNVGCSKDEETKGASNSCGISPINPYDLNNAIAEFQLPVGDYIYKQADIFIDGSDLGENIKTHVRETVKPSTDSSSDKINSEFVCSNFNTNVNHLYAIVSAPATFQKENSTGVSYARLRNYNINYYSSSNKFTYASSYNAKYSSTLSASQMMQSFYNTFDYGWYKLGADSYQLRGKVTKDNIQVTVAITYERTDLVNLPKTSVASNSKTNVFNADEEIKNLDPIKEGTLITIPFLQSMKIYSYAEHNSLLVVKNGNVSTNLDEDGLRCEVKLKENFRRELDDLKLSVSNVLNDGGVTTIEFAENSVVEQMNCYTSSYSTIKVYELKRIFGHDTKLVKVAKND